VDAGYVDIAPPAAASGYGLVEAPRGALGHFSTQAAGKVTHYQCVVPTTWNGSPKDGPDSDNTFTLRNAANTAQTKRGAIEQAMIGAPFDAAATSNGAVSGVEVLRIAQSFDPCIACAVH
jgi:Ni,Fe-hydrogenase I large subunit